MIEIQNLIDLGCSAKLAAINAPIFSKFCEKYEVNTPIRIAHFLAQVLKESGMLVYSKEIWGPTTQQLKYERNFRLPWDKSQLAFRLGNIKQGDGMRYMGRGKMQITGRDNYTRFSRDTGIDALNNPHWLEQPETSVLCAFWFWKIINGNSLADSDAGESDAFTGYNKTLLIITKRVNGGLNGISDRFKYLEAAKRVFQ